ncbi:hypothetical protein KSP40_PGU000642 [Platanthera guangdongensis]|uniref:Uncharacterized protein n=1 Tax=Platanthera guangdongensis TaxID=2320717 RepID=A0ABR2MVP0_9ASPA
MTTKGIEVTLVLDVKLDAAAKMDVLCTLDVGVQNFDLKTAKCLTKVCITMKQVTWADLSPSAGEERMPPILDVNLATEKTGVTLLPWCSSSVELKRKDLLLRKAQSFARRRGMEEGRGKGDLSALGPKALPSSSSRVSGGIYHKSAFS